jgi:hypothetical protein
VLDEPIKFLSPELAERGLVLVVAGALIVVERQDWVLSREAEMALGVGERAGQRDQTWT